ncbi:MAG: DUF1295 domain-containing protein [Candidatus Woesearchaeota archaeon]
MSVLLTSLYIALLIQLFFFIPAYLFKTDKVTDLSYGLTFIVLTLLLFSNSSYSFSNLILLLMVLLWGFRLISFLFVRIYKMKRDKRFDGIRENLFKFGGFWLIQGISVWIIMIPIIFYYSLPNKNYFIAGLFVWLIGFLFETIADYQKSKFKKSLKNRNKWIDIGVWKYSRHPNYFGEILCWIGIFIFVLPGLTYEQRLISMISPFFISSLLLFFSGIPILERNADKKWGKNKKYKLYKKKTSILIPWFKLSK